MEDGQQEEKRKRDGDGDGVVDFLVVGERPERRRYNTDTTIARTRDSRPSQRVCASSNDRICQPTPDLP